MLVDVLSLLSDAPWRLRIQYQDGVGMKKGKSMKTVSSPTDSTASELALSQASAALPEGGTGGMAAPHKLKVA